MGAGRFCLDCGFDLLVRWNGGQRRHGNSHGCAFCTGGYERTLAAGDVSSPPECGVQDVAREKSISYTSLI